MEWSRFVHAFPELGVLWHAINMEIIHVPPMILGQFSRGNPISAQELGSDWFDSLISRSFIVTDLDDEKCMEKVSEITKERRNIQAMYLILATRCNLRCAYCLYRAERSGSLSLKGECMDPGIAIESIEAFSRETAKNNKSLPGYWEEVTFYGGEPLLNFHCLERAVQYIRRMQEDGRIWEGVNFVLNTNGLLLSRNIMYFLKKEEIEIQISIDGPRSIHDSVRVFPSGKGSFDSLVSKLDKMKGLGVDFVPLVTISEANVDSLAECVEWLCRRFSIKRYGLNLMMHTGGKTDPGYGERAARSMREAHLVANSFGAVDKMYEGVFRVFSSGQVVPQSCGAGRKLVVFPRGGIHACQALEASGITAIGKLPKFEPESPNRIHWSKRNRFNNPVCLACPAIGGCGGGCGASAYNHIGDVHGIDPNHCSWMKSVFQQWLEESVFAES
ncbi:MAG: radical SAM protein [Patescibacteria group bacterium]